MKPTQEDRLPNKGKDKLKTSTTDSTPITRQGYRFGCFADEFWELLANLGTPPSQRKKNLESYPSSQKLQPL
jgi:hypothetical protein